MDLLFEIGPTDPGGMGPVVLSHQSIRAWQQDNFAPWLRLQPWEITYLRRLSGVWIEMSHKAEEFDCPPPWGEYMPEDPSERMKAAIRRMAGM